MRPIKHIDWMELSGLLVGVFITFAVMVFGIVLYAKLFYSGIIGVEEYRLHSHFEKALGIAEGTKVQINGVEVGRVSNLKLESNGVQMEFTIRKQYQNWITDSATVYAIRDQNLISSRVINIDIRKSGRVLSDGDFIRSELAQDIEAVLETANELLRRVGDLVDVADTIVALAMDTGTTVGALLGSRGLYDNLNTQLERLDKMTAIGTRLLDTLDDNLPSFLSRSDSLVGDLKQLVGGLQNMPERIDSAFNSVDVLFGKVDGLLEKADGMIENIDGMSKSLSGFIEVGEQTLLGADDVMEGLSNVWLIRRNLPHKDSVPFSVEVLW